MTVPVGQFAFVTGEVSPKLFGRPDLAKAHAAASTMRNMWPGYQGGAYSRAGTAFVGFSKQTGRTVPPRLIPFQFSSNQGLALEFGNFYMRVIYQGAFVTQPPIAVTNITQANPGVVTAPSAGVLTATANDGAVTASYAPGDDITIAGGMPIIPAVLGITNTKLLNLALNSPGIGVYAPADTIALNGGTQTTAVQLTVSSTQVVSATIAAAGSGGTNGTQTVTGTTGTGTKFQASVTVAGNAITAILSITVAGNYTVNPTTPAAEPVTGASLSGAELDLVIGVQSFTITNQGVFTANAAAGAFTQASTSGSGTGATFQSGLFGPNAVSVVNPGSYAVFPANPASQASTTGTGLGATFNLTESSIVGIQNGQWVFPAGIGGMTPLNGETFVAGNVVGNSFSLFDVYGNPINTTGFPAFTGGGTVAAIFELATPYSENDLEYLKYEQSADVMSLCCVNQVTLTEYLQQDLERLSDTDWVFTPVVAAPSVLPPGGIDVTASPSTPGDIDYEYQVTSVNPNDGSESVAGPIGLLENAVDISATAGTITITWSPIPGVNEYNIYKATPGYQVQPPTGSLFGFAGSAYGLQFLDSNVVPDFSQVPPTHQNPFARGAVIAAPVTASGSGYTLPPTITINTATGSGAGLTPVLTPVGAGFGLGAILVQPAGSGYLPTDTITISGGGGIGATATLTVGPETGSYPSVPSYFQERRAYANSLNNPDTFWMSVTGSFTNFDFRTPTIPTDAITASPWSVQVNGIQWMIQTPGGLLVMTGNSAWLLVGTGSFATNVAAIGPSSVTTNPQPFTGASPTVRPIKINYDVIYVTNLGSLYYDLPYQLYALSEPLDLTEYSSHLFVGFTIREHAYCEQPYKIIWAVRNDGAMVSLTYLKAQQVAGWGRHDTQGFFESVCSITEAPVNALYLATQRFPAGNTAYMIERMDNRIWPNGVEQTWCVDAGLTLPQPTPAATLTASSATGLGSITGVTGLVGGQNWSAATIATVVDQNLTGGLGPGAGAVPTLTIVGGVITAVTFSGPNQGAGYVFPQIVFTDPEHLGSGASATLVLNNTATFSASAGVFTAGDIGSVIRAGGGIATITAFVTTQQVTANITLPITQVIPNSGGIPIPQPAGSWTKTAPVTVISGLRHLAGAAVVGIGDGNVIPPTFVSASGQITLTTPVTSATIGLQFQAQLQSVYLDAGQPTVQGQRKKVAAVTANIEASRGLKIGSNQPDGSAQSPAVLSMGWTGLTGVPDNGPNFPLKPYNAVATPLRTGDIRIPVQGGFQVPGQVCVQQDNPLPMNILAFISDVLPGDEAQVSEPKRQQGRGG